MSKKNSQIKIKEHLKVQATRDKTIASLDMAGLIPERDTRRLYQIGSDIEPMTHADDYDLPPRGDPKSPAPLPQFKK
jgi:hypothetical protein